MLVNMTSTTRRHAYRVNEAGFIESVRRECGQGWAFGATYARSIKSRSNTQSTAQSEALLVAAHAGGAWVAWLMRLPAVGLTLHKVASTVVPGSGNYFSRANLRDETRAEAAQKMVDAVLRAQGVVGMIASIASAEGER